MVLSGVLFTPEEVTASNVKMTYQTNSVTNVIYIAGVISPGPQPVMLGIHAWATNHGYTLVASDKMDPLVNGAVNITLSNLQGTRIALYRSIQTNVAQVTFNKTVYSITNSYLNIHFCGSETGYGAAASKGFTQPFLPLSAIGRVLNDYVISPFNSLMMSTNATENQSVSIVFTDIEQGSGYFRPDSKQYAKFNTLPEIGKGLYEEEIAFCASSNFPSGSISPSTASFLLTNGAVPLSFFTGNPSDLVDTVFLVGLNPTSGVRQAVLRGLGYPITTSLRQSMVLGSPYFSDSSYSVGLSPSGSLDGISYASGNGGYLSAGDLCSVIARSSQYWNNGIYGNVQNTSGHNWLIGYSSAFSIFSYANLNQVYRCKFLSLGSDVSVSNGVISDFSATVHCYVNPTNMVTKPASRKNQQMVWDVAGGIVQAIQSLPPTNYPVGYLPLTASGSTNGMWNGWTAPPF